MQDDPAFARQALRSGALGFVLKEAADEELLEAIHLAASGESYLNAQLGARLAAQPPAPSAETALLAITDSAAAERYGLPVAKLRNASGKFVAPTTSSMKSDWKKLLGPSNEATVNPTPRISPGSASSDTDVVMVKCVVSPLATGGLTT